MVEPEAAPEVSEAQAAMRASLLAVERDGSLSAAEKALRRQQIMTKQYAASGKAPLEASAAGAGCSARARGFPPCR